MFMLVLCVWALGILALARFAHWSAATREILAYADDGICFLFLADFVVSLIRAKRRWHYFITWGWIDLLSSIPSIDLLRWGRTARILRFMRVIRGLKSARALTHF